MIAVEHITKQYGARTLFAGLSTSLRPHDRIGLVGANGSGKTTLMKILAGLETPDAGTIARSKYVTVGYLPQEGVSSSGRTLEQEAEGAFEDIVLIRRQLEEAHRSLTHLDPQSPDYADCLEVSGELQEKLENLDAYRMKSKLDRVLGGLRFAPNDLQRLVEEFSGGWQMRIALARLILQEPSLLLLDEPTNHLDLDTLTWLEDYLKHYNGAIITVSHDRAFLDRLTTRTLAIVHGRVDEYAGNFSFYEKESRLRMEHLAARAKNQQRRIQHTQQFIDRFRYKATKARQVQSRVKQMEKIELIETEQDQEEMHFDFPSPSPSGRIVVELRHVVKRYGNKAVFTDLDFALERGDRIVVVGPNGAGKSTFSRLVAGVEPFQEGTRVVGYNVALSYFAQHQADELDATKEAFQILDECAEGEIRKKLRALLGAFLFHGDDAFKKVGVLSGGEKSRLALAKMLLRPSNLLVFDEPTNHLDMRSKMVLQEALTRFEGTFLIVSHDRSFVDPLVNKVLEIKPDHARIYLGNVSDYLERKSAERETFGPIEDEEPSSTRNRDSTARDHRRRNERQRKALQKHLEAAEAELHRLEARKKALEESMSLPDLYRDGTKAKAAASEYKALQSDIDRLYTEWTELTERLDRENKE